MSQLRKPLHFPEFIYLFSVFWAAKQEDQKFKTCIFNHEGASDPSKHSKAAIPTQPRWGNSSMSQNFIFLASNFWPTKQEMRRTYVELEEDPLLGVGGSGPVSSKVSVEDVNGLLGGGFPGGGLDFVGQGLHPRLQLYLHIPLSLSLSTSPSAPQHTIISDWGIGLETQNQCFGPLGLGKPGWV